MGRPVRRPSRIGSILLAVSLLAVSLLASPVLAGPGGSVPISPDGQSLLQRLLGPGAELASKGGGRALFESVLASEAFRSGSVGPFDVHVLPGEGRSATKDADKLLAKALDTLAPAAELVSRLWPAGGGGLVSATRYPVVLATSAKDYGQLVALLDHCERAGYSGWAPANTLDTPDVRGAEVARTWEVQLFDLSNPVIADRRDGWLAHGIGYYSLAFVANRALRQGSWGLVPPWVSSGLIDELDITAYGQAWVGEESWVRQVPGWSRSGWSGFVPQGMLPPAPVTGPPAELAVTIRKTGDSWLALGASRTRHWTDLVADLKSEAPASFVRAAETESFLPRDRAAARCLLHLMLAGNDAGSSLTALLDRGPTTPPSGMPDSDPLPVVFARTLGGVPEVDRLEALDSRSLLSELGRQDLIDRLEQAKAGDALALGDHRKQAAWLYNHGCDSATRNTIFQALLEIEYVQQMAEWKALGPHLDAGLRAALAASKSYPAQEKDLVRVEQAFRAGLVQPAGTAAAAPTDSRANGKSRRK